MKVHLNQIPDHGLHVEGTEKSSILDVHDESVQSVSDVRYSLDLGVSEGGLFATGKLEADLELECVACLEQFQYPLRVPDFACQIELTGSETVDLTEAVREDILLALPPHPHCDWDGERVCKGALYRLKTETAHESLSDSQDSGGTHDVWGALDQLKIKKTN
jgi:uncharacterized metal-binding protein YceD (DUF177 family)